MHDPRLVLRGRGTSESPANRFERIRYAVDRDCEPDETPSPATQFLSDPSRSIVATNSSPDVGFNFSVNPYRGCEHGCIYCYARPSHEYLGFSAGLDFETKILVKKDAPKLLWKRLASLRWKPEVVALSGVTDPYQPIERKLELTRACLQVLLAFRNPVSIITKNRLVTRDVDVLEKLAALEAVAVTLSITTLDPSLQRIMEPRTSAPRLRLKTIEDLASRGIPVGVNVAPVIPGLTDHEIPRILEAAANAGAGHADYLLLRLPHAVAPLFESWLERHLPERKDKVLNRIRAVRGGRLNDPRFGVRHRGTGLYASQIQQLFALAKRRAGIPSERRPLSTKHFRRPAGHQLSLFE